MKWAKFYALDQQPFLFVQLLYLALFTQGRVALFDLLMQLDQAGLLLLERPEDLLKTQKSTNFLWNVNDARTLLHAAVSESSCYSNHL